MKILLFVLLLNTNITVFNRHPLNIYEDFQVLNVSAKKYEEFNLYFYFNGKDHHRLEIYQYGIGRFNNTRDYRHDKAYKVKYMLYDKGQYLIVFLLYDKKQEKYVNSFRLFINNY